MKRLLPVLLAVAATLAVPGQSIPPPDDSSAQTAPAPPLPTPRPAASSSKSGHPSNAALQAAIERLTRSNQELLDLLKQQQSVLEDIQYDRRLQNRQITLLEQRLEDTLQLNASLQAKVAGLQAQVAEGAGADKTAAATSGPTAPADAPAATVTPAPPPPPSTYLPPEQTAGPPGTMWWHRLFTLSGTDSQNSQTFRVSGKQWRVLWHNQDKPGDAYKNTSALFINAFPTGDSIPKKVCSQLGNGDDNTELTGTGEFYLKVEASGGHWELAVEDFR